MEKLQASLYDILGYLIPGAVLSAVIATLFIEPSKLKGQLAELLLTALAVCLVYVFGHCLAQLSEWLLEERLTHQVFGKAKDNLLTGSTFPEGCEVQNAKVVSDVKTETAPDPVSSPNWRSYFRFCKPMSEAARYRLMRKANFYGSYDGLGRTLNSRETYAHCFSIVIQRPGAQERLIIFLSAYGFCRNTCMAFLLATPIVWLGPNAGDYAKALGLSPFALAVISLSFGVVLYFRFLKFYRHYTKQVFELYLESQEVISVADRNIIQRPHGQAEKESDLQVISDQHIGLV